jgi:carboxymethylenebutenolidase
MILRRTILGAVMTAVVAQLFGKPRPALAAKENGSKFPLDLKKLTPEQREMVDLWEKHLNAEFQAKDAGASCDTMVAHPYVNHVPVLTGGVGRPQLQHFYGRYFIPGMPPDVEIVPISRTVGYDHIVDEFVFRFTHTVAMDWLLPGVPPTGRPVELVKVVIVTFEGGKMVSEHIHWDQASALVQLGLLDPAKLPVTGAEAARKILDPAAVPSNLLMKRTINDERL